jgi:hypothetical protein
VKAGRPDEIAERSARVNLVLVLVLWLVAAAVAVANGFMGDRLIATSWGEHGAHVYKTMVLDTVIWVLALVHALKTRGPDWARAALVCSAVWFVLSVAFEFGAGHYLFATPWEKLLADYRIWEGRIWVLVLLSELTAPLVLGFAFSRVAATRTGAKAGPEGGPGLVP